MSKSNLDKPQNWVGRKFLNDSKSAGAAAIQWWIKWSPAVKSPIPNRITYKLRASIVINSCEDVTIFSTYVKAYSAGFGYEESSDLHRSDLYLFSTQLIEALDLYLHPCRPSQQEIIRCIPPNFFIKITDDGLSLNCNPMEDHRPSFIFIHKTAHTNNQRIQQRKFNEKMVRLRKEVCNFKDQLDECFKYLQQLPDYQLQASTLPNNQPLLTASYPIHDNGS